MERGIFCANASLADPFVDLITPPNRQEEDTQGDDIIRGRCDGNQQLN